MFLQEITQHGQHPCIWTLISMQLASFPGGLDPGEVIANICPTLLVGGEEKRVAPGPTLRPIIVNVSFQGFLDDRVPQGRRPGR